MMMTGDKRHADDGVAIPSAIRISIGRPRPSPRILSDGFERLSALDFEVSIRVDGRIFEGSVTLRDPLRLGAQSGRWIPCRSTQHGPDRGWIHGGIERAISLARTIAGERADDVERRMIAALSGDAWPVARFLVRSVPDPTIDQTIWISDPPGA